MFERKVEISPAYDRRDPDPNKDYGIHGVDMRFIVIGPEGAVQFLIYTGWHLPDVQDELDHKVETRQITANLIRPMAADIGYHSPKPLYECQQLTDDEPCPYIGVPCYYDGSTLHAERVFALMVEKGGEAMWNYLEDYYRELFEETSDGTES